MLNFKKFIIYLVSLVFVFSFIFPITNIFAEEDCKTSTGAPCVKLPNPLTIDPSDNPKTATAELVGTIISTLLSIIGAVALVMFVLGSTKWITSRGNPEEVKKGAQTMLFAALGVLVVFMSYMLVYLIISYLTTGGMYSTLPR